MTDFHRIERAEGVFPVAELDWDNEYYAAMLDGKPYAYLHIQVAPGMDIAHIHITLQTFSRRILRECLYDFATLNEILKADGIRTIMVLKGYPLCNWEKLMTVLGFPYPVDIRIFDKPYKMVCMEVF